MRAFGAILIVAMILKLIGLQSVNLANSGKDTNSLTPILLAFEFVLGVWYLSGTAQRAARITAILLLTVFSAINLFKSANGLTSCGCFGEVIVPPLPVGLVEIAFAVALTVLPCRHEWKPFDGHALWMAASVMFATAALVLFNTLSTGSMSSTLFWLSGGNNPGSTVIDLGAVTGKSDISFEFPYTNSSDEPIQLSFLRSQCECMKTSNLPIWISPNQTEKIKVILSAPSTPGGFHRTFSILSSSIPIPGQVRGVVAE